MAPSNAPRTGRGGFSSNGRHARRSHDAGEDALFALSLDDVMSDRPWTADELMGGSVGAATGNVPATGASAHGAHRASHAAGVSGSAPAPVATSTPSAAPAGTSRAASDPSETAAFLAAAAQRYTPGASVSQASASAPAPQAAPQQAHAQATPAHRPKAHDRAVSPTAPATPGMSSNASETVAIPAQRAAVEASAPSRPAVRAAAAAAASETVAMPSMAQAQAQSQAAMTRPVTPASASPGPAAPEPSALEPPVMDLDDLSNRQFAFDSWAATDLDETSAGMPALDVPVNPLYAGPDPDVSGSHDDVRMDTFDENHANERIQTEDYGTVDDYPVDPFAPTPEYATPAAYADAAPTYEESAPEDRFADYYVEEEPPRFSQFSQTAKIAFIAMVVALLGLIGFEGFQLFHGATKAESEVQQKEDKNTDYLDINTLSDPNEGGGSE